MLVAAIVVAAGAGERFGSRKQFAELAGRTTVAMSVEAARAVAEFVVVVVPEDATADAHGADVVVAGGATRSSSVRAGLATVPSDAAVVVVHDAARPMATPALFRAVLEAIGEGRDAVGAVPGIAVTDTVKRIHAIDDPTVAETLDRDTLVAVQTPQAFVAAVLRRAHEGAADATDDASLVEAIGGRVVVVPGEPLNRKITTPADLDAVRASLGPR